MELLKRAEQGVKVGTDSEISNREVAHNTQT